jgi:hypothetical protein
MVRTIGLILIVFVFLPSFAWAEELWFFDKNRKIPMARSPESQIQMNQDCLQKRKKQCMSESVLKRASFLEIEKQWKSSGTNPGTLICEKLSGRVEIGRDSKKNENAFCHFSDDSWVDCGGLTKQGRNNDEHRPKD